MQPFGQQRVHASLGRTHATVGCVQQQEVRGEIAEDGAGAAGSAGTSATTSPTVSNESMTRLLYVARRSGRARHVVVLSRA